ncbi:phage virion morphogenesis protein [Marinobacterium stanieri]|uniref:Phage virion morphogenesis (Putative tail completion) protein n=1 Tax=Marinobacterium stanieri TaxID=49186 RepID=A0A1N6RPE3_9GAMM|nr:phage virion morphogenesis protein [Marinobacterium stanieri]SIQ30758.1 phage virion morphogenesis (putative tail completion) protein [Marinobacterium stanieri]
MAGAHIEINLNNQSASSSLSTAVEALENPRPLLANIREHLTRIHRKRFSEQKAPDGTPWAPLSPRYRKRKRQNSDKILVLRGYLMNTLRGVIDDDGLAFGTDRAYGAVQHFGAQIQHQARDTTLYFKRNRDGSVGNRFVKSGRSDFAQDAKVGAHTTEIPARPWLGTSDEDDRDLLALARDYLAKATSGR